MDQEIQDAQPMQQVDGPVYAQVVGGLPPGYRYKDGVMDIEPIPGYFESQEQQQVEQQLQEPILQEMSDGPVYAQVVGGLPKGYRYKDGVMGIEKIPGYGEDQSSKYMNVPEEVQPILDKVK